MPSDKIRVGIIGANPNYGWSGRAHFPALLNLPEFQVVALCTSQPETADEAAKHFGVPLAFHNYTDLVDHPDIDVVSVSVRVPFHHAMVLAALKADKHVFCEWPLGVNLSEAEEMASIAKSKGKIHMVGLQARCDPVLLRLKELVTEGYLGQVLSCTMTTFVDGTIHLQSRTMWEADKKNGAHALSIGCGHTLDALAFCIADFDQISSQVTTELKERWVGDKNSNVEVTAPDHILINGKLINGAAVSATVAYVPWFGSGWKMEVYGSAGALVASSDSYPQISRPRLKGAKKTDDSLQDIPIPKDLTWIPQEVPQGPPFNVAQMFRRFAKGINTGQPVQPDFEHAVKLHRLLETVESSSESGQRLKVR